MKISFRQKLGAKKTYSRRNDFSWCKSEPITFTPNKCNYILDAAIFLNEIKKLYWINYRAAIDQRHSVWNRNSVALWHLFIEFSECICNCVRYVLDHGNAAADAPALDCTPESEFFWPRRAFANECISLARNALFPSALTLVKLCKKCSARVRKCSERFARCASATRNSSPPGEMCIMQQRDIIAFYY